MSAKVLSNLESLGDMIGSLAGISDGLNDADYTETIIKQAHGKAADVFNLAAAATGATGHLTHVFEFGTAGITRGPVKFADPTAPEARLWVHQIEGNGGNQDIRYAFRPALNRNPTPTAKDTGVPNRYLQKLSNRKYVFWNKAFVMESGQSVQIKSDRGEQGFVFVPVPSSVSSRKFIMYPTRSKGPITAVPGKSSKGTFSAFWVLWWGGTGAELMEKDMRASITVDIEKAEAEMTKRAAAEAMKPVQATNIMAASAAGRAWMKKFFGSGRKVKEIV